MLQYLKRFLYPATPTPPPDPPIGTYPIYMQDHDEVLKAPEYLKSAPQGHEAWTIMQAANTELAAEIATLSAKGAALADSLEKADSGVAAATLLIDHSGSMRGDKVQMAAQFATVFANLCTALELPFEVLGFTTVDWRGEPVRTQWLLRGKPDFPGRLCALRHLVYSSFDEDGPPNMSALFDPSILKENIDGEALLWAADRLAAVDARRRVLVVLSDGAPVDDSTLASNWPTILEDHLIATIRELSDRGTFALGAIGLGYDVSRYYPQCTTVRTLGDLQTEALPFLGNLLGRP